MYLDKRAIKLFLRGDQASTAYIFERTCKLVKYVAFEVLHNDDDAEDVMMETFLKAMESNLHNPDSKSLINYLCSTAKHLAINAAKKSERVDFLESEEEMGGVIESLNASPLLGKAKSILGEKDYDLLIYHIGLGLSFPQIAAIQGGSASSCRGRYSRGLKKLREKIDKEEFA